MALLDWTRQDNGLRLHGEGIRLRPPRAADFAEWRDLRNRSRHFLQPWEPTWPSDDLTRGAFRRRLSAYAHDMEQGTAYPFFVFREFDGALAGGITLSNVRRGIAQTGSIGYWIGQPYARAGHTMAALRAVIDFSFRALALHRLEAACLPHNEPSRNLLNKAGFKEEGFAQAYLKINGVWRDHVLFGMVSPLGADGRPDRSVSA